MLLHDLYFPSSYADEQGTYKLLELPPELDKIISETGHSKNAANLTIKGMAAEDAVLCTANKTYAMRSVMLSDTFLVVTSPPTEAEDGENAVVIRDQVTEIIELTPTVPRLPALGPLLRGREYDESNEVLDPTAHKPYTYATARSDLQASDAELDQGLRDRRILIIDGHLRPIARDFLHRLLELALNLLISLSLSHTAAPVEVLSSTLAEEHEIPSTVSLQVMQWFGEISAGVWRMSVPSVVTEMGFGILRAAVREPIAEGEFLAKWRDAVGDSFASTVSLDLLLGNYVASSPSPGRPRMLTYYPISSLPVDPAARFADLFLTRPRWKADDLLPFLADISVDMKERDKLLLKYCRATSDAHGVWYTARAHYNG